VVARASLECFEWLLRYLIVLGGCWGIIRMLWVVAVVLLCFEWLLGCWIVLGGC